LQSRIWVPTPSPLPKATNGEGKPTTSGVFFARAFGRRRPASAWAGPLPAPTQLRGGHLLPGSSFSNLTNLDLSVLRARFQPLQSPLPLTSSCRPAREPGDELLCVSAWAGPSVTVFFLEVTRAPFRGSVASLTSEASPAQLHQLFVELPPISANIFSLGCPAFEALSALTSTMNRIVVSLHREFGLLPAL